MKLTEHLAEIAAESGVDPNDYFSCEKKNQYKGHKVESWYDEDSASPYAWHAWTKGIGGSGGQLSREEAIEEVKRKIDAA